MFEKNLLGAKRILVTGGGSGLGAAMGRRFLQLGAELVICGRRLELLEATAAKMRRDEGGKVTTIRCDIRDGASVEAMMDAIWRDGPLDVLVNNAAATFIAQTEQLSFRAADAILAPTLHGAKSCGRMGTEGHPYRRDRARRVPDARFVRPASSQGPRRMVRAQSARPCRRASRVGRSREFPDLGCGGLHQWRDGGAGWWRAFAHLRRGGPAAMDRRP